MLSLYKLVVASTLALQATAKTVRVDVGNGGLKFTPNAITADKGDILEFHFFAVNHSVVQGRFDKPCVPAESKPIFSGFTGPIAAGQESPRVFSVTVNDTNPIVFYCSQNTGFHCARGMYATVNAGARPQNLDGYKALISGNITAVSPPGGPNGGVFSVQAGNSTSTTGSGGSSSTVSPPTSTGSGNGNGNGGGDSQTTPAPTGTAPTGSGTPQTTSKPGAGAHVQASVGGLLVAALGAALMI